MGVPLTLHAGTCRSCQRAVDGGNDALVYNTKLGLWQCKDCFWTDVLAGNTSLGEYQGSCSECGDDVGTDDSAYCSSCYENAGDRPNACDNCGDDDDSVYCSSCHDSGEESPECDTCSRTASYHQCDRHADTITCDKCMTEKPLSEFVCAACAAGPSAIAVVSDDGGSITVGDTEIAWVN